jgi:DNA-binding NarL/FixJ family response regulator
MLFPTPSGSPEPQSQQGLPTNEQRALELAELQARAEVEAAKAAVSLLGTTGLLELRGLIDSRLAGGRKPEARADAYLSEQEAKVLRLIALGHSNKEIAALMQVSVKTVETYKSRAMEKLQLRTRVQIVRYAIGCGWMGAT